MNQPAVQADGSEETFHFSGAAATLQETLKLDIVDMHLEVDIIPVSDVERSKRSYGRFG